MLEALQLFHMTDGPPNSIRAGVVGLPVIDGLVE